jgi:hypothetical protein
MVDDVNRVEIDTATRSHDPETGLRAVTALRRLADQLEERHVALARRRGWSWEQIGDALGISRQAAHKKHSTCSPRASRRA